MRKIFIQLVWLERTTDDDEQKVERKVKLNYLFNGWNENENVPGTFSGRYIPRKEVDWKTKKKNKKTKTGRIKYEKMAFVDEEDDKFDTQWENWKALIKKNDTNENETERRLNEGTSNETIYNVL